VSSPEPDKGLHPVRRVRNLGVSAAIMRRDEYEMLIRNEMRVRSRSAAQAAPAVVHVHFHVSGTGEPSIQYGSDSDEINTPGGLGTLGDGNALPRHAARQARCAATLSAQYGQAAANSTD